MMSNEITNEKMIAYITSKHGYIHFLESNPTHNRGKASESMARSNFKIYKHATMPELWFANDRYNKPALISQNLRVLASFLKMTVDDTQNEIKNYFDVKTAV